MSGETDLKKLLGSMSPEMIPGVYVFSTFPAGEQVPADLNPLMTFREREGTTMILPEEKARECEIAFSFTSRMITLNVHSSLEAIGFLAAVTTRLAAAGISVNPVSAYFHDHLFVPVHRAAEAVAILKAIATESTG